MIKIKKLVILAIFIQIYYAFEVSKLGVKYYNQTSEINVYANELTSQKTQLPFDYFYLNFCPTDKKIVQDENLGSLILGDVQQITSYDVEMLENEECKIQCIQKMKKQQLNDFKWMIEREYKQTLVIDNLPNLFENLEGNFEVGVPLGYYEKEDGKKKYYLYNHLTFTIKYHKKAVQQQNLKKNEKQQEQIQQYYVVEFFVDPESSYTNNIDGQIIPACELYNESPDNLKQEINVGEDDTYIAFTYDIVFEESDIDYTTRWDIYKKTLGEDEIHWFSLMNSMLIILFLTIILGQVLKRTLNRDIQRYSQVDQQEDLQQDLGWKQLQREVFRSPKRAIFMSTFTGVGIQIFCMTFITLTFTVIGIDQETVRGSFLNSLIICYVFMGTVSGYWSARIYKMLGGVYWLRSTLLVSLLYPSIVFGILFAVDFLLSLEGSMSMGFVVIIELITLWLGVSTPLVFIGAFFGFRREKIENPCSVNPVPNYIPPQPWYLQKKVIYIVGGLLPFASMLMEFSYIMQSIWHHNQYYLFLFLFLVLIIVLVICAEMSIVVTYLQLTHGNYKWQWTSFFTPAMCGVYSFIFSIFYFMNSLNIDRFTSTIMYYGFNFVISLTLFLLCGTVGYLSSLIFIRRIYSLIKAD